MRKLQLLISLVAAVSLAVAVSLAAQEHPARTSEHPKPEHPTGHAISMADLEKSIHEQIDAKTKEGGGHFQVHDPVLNKDWALQLVRIHTDKLTQLDANTYFACTDFRADDGTLLDVDFYLKNEDGKLAFSDTAIHKINGKPRFTYKKKNGFWERVKT